MSSATPTTTAMLTAVSARLPKTWPASTEGRQRRIVLKRAMMPWLMSMATEIATICAAPAIVNTSIPGVTNST